MTAIKICGIKKEETYRQLQELAVDYIGFVFAKSKRQVTAEQVAAIRQAVDGENRRVKTAQLVGVFVDETPAELARIADRAGLDVLQLHGDEPPAVCRELRAQGFRVWKAWGVCNDERDRALAAYHGAVDAVLLDNMRGGSGARFPWTAIETLRAYLPDVPFFVAGGLALDNVSELLTNHSPDGVDISSGVETDGDKDPDKIRAFVSKVRETR